MSISFDPVTDRSGKDFYRICQEIPLPEFFKSASYDEFKDYDSMKSQEFADPSRKMFPIGSAAQTYASIAFMLDKTAEYKVIYGRRQQDVVNDRLEKAQAFWGIEDAVSELKTTGMQKSASEDLRFLGEIEVDGTTHRFYPVKTASDVVAAAHAFVQDLQKLQMDDRFKVAESIVKAQEEFEVTEDFHPTVWKYAGAYFPALEHVQAELARRESKIKSAACRSTFEHLRGLAKEASSIEDFRHIASVCYQVERMDGCYDLPKVARELQDPVETIFTLSPQKVASMIDFVEMGGAMFKMADLKAVKPEIYKEAFGIDIDTEDTTALRDVLPTMPRSDVGLFQELSGVKAL